MQQNGQESFLSVKTECTCNLVPHIYVIYYNL